MRKLYLQWILVGCFVALCGGVTAFVRLSNPSEDEIDIAEAIRVDSPLWIDARSTADFEREHVPNAISLNEDNWSQAIVEVLSQWSPRRKIIVYCTSETCASSRAVATRLRGSEYNLENVYVLKGGWRAWKAWKSRKEKM